MATPHGWRAWLWPWVIGLTVTLAITFAVHQLLDESRWWEGLVVFGAASLWVVWDARRIRLRDYRTQLANEPVMLLFLAFAFWAIVFPWYLIVREGIRRGLVPKRRRIQNIPEQ